MAETAPDEILDQILSYVLCMPQGQFERWRTPKTFTSNQSSNIIGILPTCSRWYRIGIPLLYGTVILRTRKEVLAFAEAVSKPNKDGLMLGQYLRRLRMEASYCAEFNDVLYACSNIAELFLAFDLSTEDQLGGLASALQSINPSRLMLDSLLPELLPEPTSIIRPFYEAVSDSAAQWTRLVSLETLHNLPSQGYLAHTLIATETSRSKPLGGVSR